MTTIYIKTDSHYKVDRKRIRKLIDNFLTEKKVTGEAEVSVSIVGDRQMKALNKKYRNIDATTDVLAFSLIDSKTQSKFIDPPDNILRLGDIIISYPQVIEEASESQKLVDDQIDALIIHGLKNLLGMGE